MQRKNTPQVKFNPESPVNTVRMKTLKAKLGPTKNFACLKIQFIKNVKDPDFFKTLGQQAGCELGWTASVK